MRKRTGAQGQHVVRRTVRWLLNLLLTTALATALTMGLSIALGGMYLLGVPAIEDVQKVTIAYPARTDAVKEIEAADEIELAVKLTGYLKYAMLEKADAQQAPMMTITYQLKDGRSVAISANRDVVWWQGRARALKEKGMFINLAEGIFFLPEVIGE